jgi:VanZ family protein
VGAPEPDRSTAAPQRCPRWRSPRAIVAWLAVLAFVGVIFWLGSSEFSAQSKSRFVIRAILYLFPDFPRGELWRAYLIIRKLAHLTEYGLLALLSFRAMWITFDSILARLAAGTLVLAISVATIDETRQSFSSVRTGSFFDVLLDTSGALIAIGAAMLYLRWQQRRRRAEA